MTKIAFKAAGPQLQRKRSEDALDTDPTTCLRLLEIGIIPGPEPYPVKESQLLSDPLRCEQFRDLFPKFGSEPLILRNDERLFILSPGDLLWNQWF